MGDGTALLLREGEFVERGVSQARGKVLEQLHAARGRGKVARNKDLFLIAPRAVVRGDGIHKRVAVLDCGHAGHAAKEVAGRSFRKKGSRKSDEGFVHIVLRDCGGDAVDVRGRQFLYPRGKDWFPKAVYRLAGWGNVVQL